MLPRKRQSRPRVTPEDIMNLIMPEPMSGCWFWTGTIDRHGYGKVRGKLAHRVVYEMLRHPIADGLELDHKCRVRCCVNPDHVEPVTPLENWRRGFSFSAENKRRTHCPAGHAYDEKNTYRRPATNHRICRTCNLAHHRRYQSSRAAAVGGDAND